MSSYVGGSGLSADGDHYSAIFLSLLSTGLFFILADSLDVVPSIRMVGFVVGDDEPSHRIFQLLSN
jgi:hypothetical protein